VTSVARTLLDLAEVLSARRLLRVLEEAERLRLFDLDAIDRLAGRSHGRRGLGELRLALAGMDDEPPPTRSELERRFLELCRAEHLPPPAVNAWLAGFEVDALWPEQRLVVELDGYAFHGARAAFERDRVRDAAIQLAGYRVLRVTHRRLAAEPGAVAEAVRALLDAAPRASRREVRESRRNVQPKTGGASSG
jgi:very-short-patch-repair endonuclease